MRKCLGLSILVALFCLPPAHAASAQPSMTAVPDARLAAIFSVPKPTPASTCSATASCPSGTISCGPVTLTGTTVCVGVDQNCLGGERGYVQCGSTRVDCPDLCPDLCFTYNRQFPGCNYTWDPQGQCCASSDPSCPAVNLCQ